MSAEKIRFAVLFFVLLISLASLCYVVGWQHNMTCLLIIDRELEKDGAKAWRNPLIEEMKCFPVKNEKKSEKIWCYENGYGQSRDYGGQRKHEGIDIMPSAFGEKSIPIQSVSDGVVEKIGWLELGGYRVGIRSKSGLYFYYAHLDSYAPGLKKGEWIKAGEVLGIMGDTGYGREGTRGKFPIHLHFGIYYKNGKKEESLNPFYLLQYKECGMIEEYKIDRK